MTDRRGQKVRIILVGDRFYSGEITSETEILLTIKDKFGKAVTIGKSHIISMEVVE